MKALLAPKLSTEVQSTSISTGLLILRVAIGVAFVAHGFGKIQAPMNWMGPEAPVPGALQALAAIAEFGGGIGLILGLLTPLASLGLIFVMLGALSFHLMNGDPFVGGYELALIYLAANILLFLTGPGSFSLDKLIFAKGRR